MLNKENLTLRLDTLPDKRGIAYFYYNNKYTGISAVSLQGMFYYGADRYLLYDNQKLLGKFSFNLENIFDHVFYFLEMRENEF